MITCSFKSIKLKATKKEKNCSDPVSIGAEEITPEMGNFG